MRAANVCYLLCFTSSDKRFWGASPPKRPCLKAKAVEGSWSTSRRYRSFVHILWLLLSFLGFVFGKRFLLRALIGITACMFGDVLVVCVRVELLNSAGSRKCLEWVVPCVIEEIRRNLMYWQDIRIAVSHFEYFNLKYERSEKREIWI